MRASPIRFSFRERMQGPFSAGAPTPEVGAIRGRTEGSVAVADLEVTIEDLEQFFADPRHVAQLRGSVTLPQLATARPLASGELEMYVPDLQRSAKLLRYSFTFSGNDEAPYFFRGVKVLRTPFPSLRAQVTLFSEVRAGGENGPLWGAGILTFRWRDLPAFLGSMRAEGCSRALALWRFGRFAQRELAFAPV